MVELKSIVGLWKVSTCCKLQVANVTLKVVVCSCSTQ